MIEKEAISELQDLKNNLFLMNYVPEAKKIKECAIFMAIAAFEKQIPKKPIRSDLCTCPKCGTYNEVVKKRRNTVNLDVVYCWHCGQAMEAKRSDAD